MKLRHLPNAISIARMLLVVPIVAWLLAGDYEAAWWLFLFAGASDAVACTEAVRQPSQRPATASSEPAPPCRMPSRR